MFRSPSSVEVSSLTISLSRDGDQMREYRKRIKSVHTDYGCVYCWLSLWMAVNWFMLTVIAYS